MSTFALVPVTERISGKAHNLLLMAVTLLSKTGVLALLAHGCHLMCDTCYFVTSAAETP